MIYTPGPIRDRAALFVCLGIIACVPLSAVLGIAQWWEVGHATVNACAIFAGVSCAWLAVIGQRIARRRKAWAK